MNEIIKAVQRKVGVNDDGVAGPKTWSAISKALGIDAVHTSTGTIFDPRSEGNIATLLPSVQVIARAFLQAVLDADISAKIISGTRTYQEQNALYEQGRTKPGNIVTNARGGYSWHNFGVAWDIGIFRGTEYLDDGPEYAAAGSIGKSLGLEWGGDWKSIQDRPHFQYNPNHLTLAEARSLHDSGKTMAA